MKKINWKKTAIALLILLITAAAIFACCWKNTPIPKLRLQGDISEMLTKEDVRTVAFTYDDGKQEISGYAEIKIQGTSSISYDKKNYTLKFFEDEALDNKLKIDVGWGPQSKYCMKANWIDRTHARNVVTAKLASKVQQQYGILTEAPRNGLVDGFPVEIYDNGSFLGLYTFNIPKDEWQFAMDGDNPDHIVICGEGWEKANNFRGMPDFETWAVEVGEESDETLEKMNRLFDFVLNSSDEEFKANFEQYFNLDAALNYYVISDIAWLADNRGKNMLIATYDGMEWYLSLYDLDSSWGSYIDGWHMYNYDGSSTLKMGTSRLFKRMQEAFPNELAQRYYELREGILSDESIMAEFEAFRDQIPAMTFLKEAVRWGEGPVYRSEDLPGHGYDQIREYLQTVSPKLEAKYSAMLQQ